MKSHLQTEISIRSTPEQIWSVLTAFAEYPKWNPFIQEASGALTIGLD